MILAFYAYAQKPEINSNNVVTNRARGLNRDLSLHLYVCEQRRLWRVCAYAQTFWVFDVLDNAIRTKNLVPADMYKMYPCFTELVSVEQCRDCFVLLRVYYCTNYI